MQKTFMSVTWDTISKDGPIYEKEKENSLSSEEKNPEIYNYTMK